MNTRACAVMAAIWLGLLSASAGSVFAQGNAQQGRASQVRPAAPEAAPALPIGRFQHLVLGTTLEEARHAIAAMGMQINEERSPSPAFPWTRNMSASTGGVDCSKEYEGEFCLSVGVSYAVLPPHRITSLSATYYSTRLVSLDALLNSLREKFGNFARHPEVDMGPRRASLEPATFTAEWRVQQGTATLRAQVPWTMFTVERIPGLSNFTLVIRSEVLSNQAERDYIDHVRKSEPPGWLRF